MHRWYFKYTVDLISFHFCPGIKSQSLVMVGGVLIKFIFMGPHKETMKRLQGANHIQSPKNGKKKQLSILSFLHRPHSEEKNVAFSLSHHSRNAINIAKPNVVGVVQFNDIHIDIEQCASSLSFDWAFDSMLVHIHLVFEKRDFRFGNNQPPSIEWNWTIRFARREWKRWITKTQTNR